MKYLLSNLWRGTRWLSIDCQIGNEMKPLLKPKRAGEYKLYARLRDWPDLHSEERRDFFNTLWKEYAPFAPKRNKSDVGPDITLELQENVVYVEAVAPSIGCSSDNVPEPVENGVANFPERECLLRLTQALTAKKERFQNYIDEGIVPGNACRIIAMSATRLNQFGTLLDSVHPAPLSVLAGAGPMVIPIGEKEPAYSGRRSILARDSGSSVDAALFDSPEFSIVSAVLYSPLDLWNAPLIPGEFLSLFLNPSADIQVPSMLTERFVTWTRQETESTEIIWKKSTPEPV